MRRLAVHWPIQDVHSFTSGANNTFLSYCLTSNGNVTQLITPAGHFEIEVPVEGYGICDGFTGTEYFDYAFEDSLNWGPTTATRLSPTSMKFVRTTSDGVWTLTQTITQVATSSSLKVAMALKNNTADNRPMELLRYADVDVDGVLTNNFDGTLNSAMGWNSFSLAAPIPLASSCRMWGQQHLTTTVLRKPSRASSTPATRLRVRPER
jgi:hypothetical protein